MPEPWLVTDLSLCRGSLSAALLRVDSCSEEGGFPGVHVILGLTGQVQGLGRRNTVVQCYKGWWEVPWNLWTHSSLPTDKSQTCVVWTWKSTQCPLTSVDQGEACTSCLFPEESSLYINPSSVTGTYLLVFEPRQALWGEDEPVVPATAWKCDRLEKRDWIEILQKTFSFQEIFQVIFYFENP